MRYSLLIVFSLLLIYKVPAQNLDFELTGMVGTPVNSPKDVAIDKAGNIYMLESNTITKTDATGKFLEKITLNTSNGYSTNLFLDIDQAGNIYAADYYGICVYKYNPKGQPLLKIGSPGTGPGAFKYVGPVALDDQENIYVADLNLPRVQKFNAQGQVVKQFGPGSTAGDSLHFVKDVGVDAEGNVYVLDSKYFFSPDFTVFKYGPAGNLLQKFTVTQPGPSYNTNRAYSMTVAKNGSFYLVYTFTRDILHYGPDGRLIRNFAGHGVPVGGLANDQINLAQDGQGNIYASDNYHIRPSIKKYASNGTFLQQFGYDKSFSTSVYDRFNNLFLFENNNREIHKYDAAGNLKLKFSTKTNLSTPTAAPELITVDQLGSIYSLNNEGTRVRIKKFSSSGILIRESAVQLPKPTANGVYARGMTVDKAGNLYIADAHGNVIHKISGNGEYLAAMGKPGEGPGEFSYPQSVAIDGVGFIYTLDLRGNRIQKFSPSGEFMMEYGDKSTNSVTNFSNISVDGDGNVFLSYRANFTSHLKLYNRLGKLQKQLAISNSSIAVNPSGDAFAIGLYDGTIGIYTSKTKQSKAYITGKIFQDLDGNCTPGNSEKPVSGIVVMAEPGPYYGISDEVGDYLIPVDTGRYTIQTILPQEPGRAIIPTCTGPNTPVEVSNYGIFYNGPDFGNQVSTAPVLHVNIASDRRRRCFRNVTTVSYSNSGFAVANKAKVTVQLPEFVSFISADKPHSKDHKGNYIFAVGDLQPNQRGTITIIDSVSCADPSIRGLTVCTKAWITPVNTYPAPPAWNQAEIAVTAKLTTDSQARFVIRNIGQGAMTDSLFFRVYQDADLILVNSYKLAVQDSLVLRFNPNGRVIRVEVEQPEGHPIKAIAGANLEIPKNNVSGLPAILMMAYPPDEPEPEIGGDCQPIIDSFDPNDKQVIPVGLTSEHYTPTNTPLRYTIRFQNTGTDVAYRVVIVDTLSTDLDMSTFQVNAATHAYQLTVTGKQQPVVTFTFDNIMLPDSSHDQAGSNGLIQFNIKPKRNLPEKTKIENFADIFFDYNEAVRTNTTTNRIFDIPQVLSAEKQLKVQEVIISPSIKGFSPVQSRAGSIVTITGRHFEPNRADNKVTFNGVAATVLNATPSTLTVLVPTKAFTGKIKVVTSNGATHSNEDFIIFQPPTLTTVSPDEAVPGTVVTLTGNYFSLDAEQDTVTISGLPAKVVEVSETQLKVEVPNGATTGKILIRTLGGQVESEKPFVVWYPPVIFDFNPGKARGGATVILTGQNFAETAARNIVQFGSTTAEVLQASATRLLVKVPPGAQSGKIKVQTPGGQTTTPSGFTFIPAPEIASFTPAQGNAGTTVTITGFNFQADGQADTVYFNDKPAKVLKATETSLVVLAPKGVSSGPISITGAGGKAVTSDFKVLVLEPQEAITVYPNPAKGKITINWYKADFTVESLRIYNAIGKMVWSKDLPLISTDELQLTLSPLAPGVYTIRLQTSAGLVLKRVMVF